MSTPELSKALSAVGSTAVVVACCRALEARRADAWFHDPLAAHVAAARPDVTTPPQLVAWLAIRTRFLDELVGAAARAGTRQVVLLGAGLDARAFRLDWPPSTTVYEVDRGEVLDVKTRLVEDAGLTPTCRRRVVAADLAQPGWSTALAAAGWEQAKPTCWVAEGLLIYLEAAQREALVAALAGLSASGSRLGVTDATAARAAQKQLWRSGIDGDPVQWFAQYGWRARVRAPRDVLAGYGRWSPTTPPDSPSTALLVDAVPSGPR